MAGVTPGVLRLGATRHPYNGHGEITDLVQIKGSPDVPVSRPVRLYHKKSGRLVKQVQSGEDGSFSFAYILLGVEYIVLAEDTAMIYHPASVDHVTAKPMEY